jgi:hypothetical protein
MYHNINTQNAKASSVDLAALILRHRRNLRSLLGRRKVKRERGGGGGERPGLYSLSNGFHRTYQLDYRRSLSPNRAWQLYRMVIAGTSVAAATLGTAIKETHGTYKSSWIMWDMKTTRSTHETTSYLLTLHSPTEDVNKSQHNKQ